MKRDFLEYNGRLIERSELPEHVKPLKRYAFEEYNGRLIERSELPEYVKTLKEHRARARRKETIRKHVRLKDLKWYVTITFDPKKKDRFSKNAHSLTELLRWHRFEYYLIPEYHEDGAIHYHGFLSDKKGAFKYFGQDKKGRHFWTCEPLTKNYGINRCYYLINAKMINYVSKYAVKQGSRALYSRIKANHIERRCVELFGDLAKFV